MLIADDIVHLVLHQSPEVGAVTVDAEGIGQRDPRLAAPGMGRGGGLAEGGLALILVEKIALKEQVGAVLHHLFVQIVGAEIGARAKIGVHRPFAIRRHEDHRA